jgi:hypothetical protein
MDASATELDTFKIISNADTVDWSRSLSKPVQDDDWGGVLSEENEVSEEAHLIMEPPSPRLPSPRLSLPRTSPPRNVEFARSHTPPLPPSPKPKSEDKEEASAEPPVEEPRAPRRFVRAPVKYTASEENEDYEIRHEKEALLNEILGFTRPPHNYKLTREWNILTHTLDELQFELDRINSEINANSVVDMAKSGIKFGVSGIEMFLKQQGFDAADGWYSNSCKDMSKFNRPLTRLYKKYWRNTQLSPLTEMAYLLGGSLAWTIAENKMGMRKSSVPTPPAVPRASAFEPDAAQPGKMRPPSNSFIPSKWAQSEQKAPESEPPKTEPKSEPKSEPKAERSQSDEEMIKKLSEQNALMMQMLEKSQSALPVTHVSPPQSKSNSPNIRIRSIGGKRSTRTPRIIKQGNDSLAL